MNLHHSDTMNTQRPTPRTDQHEEAMTRAEHGLELALTYNFARDLERELAETRETLENLEACAIHSCGDHCQRPACKTRREAKAMRAAIQEAFTALDECHEDTCELSAERDWWKNEPRCGYSERWAQMQVRKAKAVAALAALKPFLPESPCQPGE